MSRGFNTSMLDAVLRDPQLLDPYQFIQLVLNVRGVTLDSGSVFRVKYLQ